MFMECSENVEKEDFAAIFWIENLVENKRSRRKGETKGMYFIEVELATNPNIEVEPAINPNIEVEPAINPNIEVELAKLRMI
ncbi:hypothetical protein AVEN_42962-1 [Araneus ventricosus]|uniref:Uncharacterized protein n=1 Tax=Araneus ventricosus TaxID=182803 RepID=A0A4Y2AGX5_ARAVE|nr:hypothetical protein AVEN_42962-1 [Araneus ventricosus]